MGRYMREHVTCECDLSRIEFVEGGVDVGEQSLHAVIAEPPIVLAAEIHVALSELAVQGMMSLPLLDKEALSNV
jgi:hypothetical protein